MASAPPESHPDSPPREPAETHPDQLDPGQAGGEPEPGRTDVEGTQEE